MRLVAKALLDLTQKELRQCKSLSLRAGGLMCEDIRDWKEYETSGINKLRRKTRVWMILEDDSDRLLAWALATPGVKRGYTAQFYTRVTERGKGFGSLLMQEVLKLDPKPYVYPHDKTSGDFFKKHQGKIRFDSYDSRWLA
jgi:GNAT superfamily N-acetyltransferase